MRKFVQIHNEFSFINVILSAPEQPDEDAIPRTAPVFVSKPESVQVEEGEWARFCARVTGHPRPRVMWLVNGHTVVNVSRTFLLLFLYLR